MRCKGGGVCSGVLFSEAAPQPFGSGFARVGPLVSRGGVAVRLRILVASGGGSFGLCEFGFAFGLCEFILVAKDGWGKEAVAPFAEHNAGPAVLVSVQASVDLGESQGAFLVREQDPARDKDDECSCSIHGNSGVSMGGSAVRIPTATSSMAPVSAWARAPCE